MKGDRWCAAPRTCWIETDLRFAPCLPREIARWNRNDSARLVAVEAECRRQSMTLAGGCILGMNSNAPTELHRTLSWESRRMKKLRLLLSACNRSRQPGTLHQTLDLLWMDPQKDVRCIVKKNMGCSNLTACRIRIDDCPLTGGGDRVAGVMQGWRLARCQCCSDSATMWCRLYWTYYVHKRIQSFKSNARFVPE